MFKRSVMKVIDDPVSGIIDIAPVLPIVETRAFQALDDKRQLGMTYLVFRSAKHTRFIHSLGSYWTTRALADRWVREGSINSSEGAALSVFALLHDVGHSAFSHTTEDFCLKDHHLTTLDLIRGELRAPIEACGVDADLVADMASRNHPIHRAVCDKNIGMEKLDYLERDGLSTVLSRPPGIAYVRNYVFYVDGQLVIDKKIVEHVLDIMNFYMKMYKGVYLRKSLVIAQRMLHKAVHHLIEAGELERRDLPGMIDSELLGKMHSSRDPVVEDIYLRLRDRRLYKEGLVFRTMISKPETRVGGKHIKVVGVTDEEMHLISSSPALQRKNHASLERLEASVADVLGIPSPSILVVPVFYPERFVTEDVKILGGTGNIRSLRDRRPDHFRAMDETARSYAALRICACEEYRAVLTEPRTLSKVQEAVYSFL